MPISREVRHVVLFTSIVAGILTTIFGWRMLAQFLLQSSDISTSVSLEDRLSPRWFILHPLLSIIGSIALPIPGVILRKYKGYWSKKVHAYVFVLAILATFTGVYVIYVQKDAREKLHLASWHAIAGATICFAYLSVGFVGLAALDPDHAFISKKSVKGTFKWVHKTGGRLLLVGGYLVCLSGWYKFFEGEDFLRGVAVVIAASLLTYLDQIVSICQRETATKTD